MTQTTASTFALTFKSDEGAATGTAHTTCAAPRWRTAPIAASMVEPVARPSSTTMTVLPATSTAGLSAR